MPARPGLVGTPRGAGGARAVVVGLLAGLAEASDPRPAAGDDPVQPTGWLRGVPARGGAARPCLVPAEVAGHRGGAGAGDHLRLVVRTSRTCSSPGTASSPRLRRARTCPRHAPAGLEGRRGFRRHRLAEGRGRDAPGSPGVGAAPPGPLLAGGDDTERPGPRGGLVVGDERGPRGMVIPRRRGEGDPLGRAAERVQARRPGRRVAGDRARRSAHAHALLAGGGRAGRREPAPCPSNWRGPRG